MKKQSRIENLISKFLQLHDRKIDLSLDRINRLNKDLKINIDNLQAKTVTLSGTNGKWSTATTIRSIFEAAGYKVDLLLHHMFKVIRKDLYLNLKKFQRKIYLIYCQK